MAVRTSAQIITVTPAQAKANATKRRKRVLAKQEFCMRPEDIGTSMSHLKTSSREMIKTLNYLLQEVSTLKSQLKKLSSGK